MAQSVEHCSREDGSFNRAMVPIYKHGLALIPTCISNDIHYKVLDDIT